MSIKHLQTEEPTMPFEQWWLEVVTLFAEAWKIDKPACTRRLDIDTLEKEWYKEGFSPYATFRENFSPLY